MHQEHTSGVGPWLELEQEFTVTGSHIQAVYDEWEKIEQVYQLKYPRGAVWHGDSASESLMKNDDPSPRPPGFGQTAYWGEMESCYSSRMKYWRGCC